MALETILVKDAAGTNRGVIVDKIGAGEDYVQVNKLAYGADGTVTLLEEKPATEAAQTSANAALGAPADAEAASGDGSIVALLKRARTLLGNIATALSGTLTVGGTVAVSNLPATQPVSGTVSVSGGATAANQATANAALGAPADAEASADGSIVALLKRLRTLLGGTLAVALPASQQTPSGAVRIGNSRTKIRDEFPTGGLKSALWDLIATGAGMTVTTGNGTTGSYLLIASGTTINSETIIRSKDIVSLPARLAAFVTASQRIANQEFFVELIEVDASGVPVVGTAQTNAGTSPNHASVKFDGTTATNALVTVRSGNAPEFVSAANTIVTTVATGTGPNFFPAGMVELQVTGEHVQLLQAAIDVTTAATVARRITQAAPDPEALYKLQIRARNLGTAPASSTDWRVHAIRLFDYARLDVSVIGGPGHGAAGSSVPVNVSGGSLSLTGTLPAIVGQAAHDAVLAGNPVRVAARALTANYAAVASGDTADLITTLVGALIQKPYAIPEVGWNANVSLTGTTAAPIIAAAGAGLRRYIAALQAINMGASAVELIILDGATERWRFTLPVNVPVPIPFPTELTVTANTALNGNLSAAGTVRVCAQGYNGP